MSLLLCIQFGHSQPNRRSLLCFLLQCFIFFLKPPGGIPPLRSDLGGRGTFFENHERPTVVVISISFAKHLVVIVGFHAENLLERLLWRLNTADPIFLFHWAWEPHTYIIYPLQQKIVHAWYKIKLSKGAYEKLNVAYAAELDANRYRRATSTRFS